MEQENGQDNKRDESNQSARNPKRKRDESDDIGDGPARKKGKTASDGNER